MLLAAPLTCPVGDATVCLLTTLIVFSLQSLSPPKGVWKPRKIDNPDYFEDLQPFRMAPFKAVGLELWSMTSDIYFDNFIITSHKEVADRWASDSWGLKKLVASANEVSGVSCKGNRTVEQRPNRLSHCHCVHIIYHRAVCLCEGKGSQRLTICSCPLVPCLSSPLNPTSRGFLLS